MTPWMRLLLPVGFGIVAAVINFFVLNKLNQQTEYVCVGGKAALGQGTPFTDKNIAKLKVSGEAAKLNKAWITWDDRHTIYGRPAGRTMQLGELVLRQDAQPVKELKPGPGYDAMVISLGTVEVEPKLLLIGEEIGFLIRTAKPPSEDDTAEKPPANKFSQPKKLETADMDIKYLGPFRLLSVGDRLSRNVGESKKDNRGDGRTVTIAIKKIKGQEKLDDNVERLVRASTKSGGRGESDLLKLVLHRSLLNTEAITPEAVTKPGESDKGEDSSNGEPNNEGTKTLDPDGENTSKNENESEK